MSRVADIVAQTLAHHGLRHAFGMPGGEVITLIDALGKSGIKFVLSRQESSAAIMAAGTSVLTGAPGVLVTTLGPGLANAVNGIADASQEHVPLLVFSGVVDHDIRGRYTHQVIDQRALLAPIVKASFEIEARGPGATIARAIQLALTPPLGPVHIDFAPGTAAKPAHGDDRAHMPTHTDHPAVCPDDPCIRHIRGKLGVARRPLILAGYDAVRAGVGDELRTLVDRLQVPVLTTYKAKGILPEDHPCAMGGAGLSPLADGILMEIVDASDFILLLGYDPIEMRQGWMDPFPKCADVVELTAHQPDHAMHRIDKRVVAPLGPALAAVTPDSSPSKPIWCDDFLSARRRKLETAFESPDAWGPHAVFNTLQNTIPGDTILTVDSGAHRILMSQLVKISRPHGLMQSAGFCTMGAALPLAVGAKVSCRRRPVVCVVGDGGLEMGLGELATLRDQNLPVVVVVLQDESLALIELKQQKAGLPESGVRLGATRFEQIAEAFGGSGARVASTSDLAQALTRAFDSPSFTIIVCDIEASSYDGRI